MTLNLLDASSTAADAAIESPRARTRAQDVDLDEEPVLASGRAWTTALWYVSAELRTDEVTSNATGGFDGGGRAVAPEGVAEVGIVDR